MGLSMRRNKLGIGQSMDVAEKQSCMRNAKTIGKSAFICFALIFL